MIQYFVVSLIVKSTREFPVGFCVSFSISDIFIVSWLRRDTSDCRETIRSSCSQMYYKIGVLENCKIHRKTPVKTPVPKSLFPVNFAKFLRTPFFNHFQWLFLNYLAHTSNDGRSYVLQWLLLIHHGFFEPILYVYRFKVQKYFSIRGTKHAKETVYEKTGDTLFEILKLETFAFVFEKPLFSFFSAF